MSQEDAAEEEIVPVRRNRSASAKPKPPSKTKKAVIRSDYEDMDSEDELESEVEKPKKSSSSRARPSCAKPASAVKKISVPREPPVYLRNGRRSGSPVLFHLRTPSTDLLPLRSTPTWYCPPQHLDAAQQYHRLRNPNPSQRSRRDRSPAWSFIRWFSLVSRATPAGRKSDLSTNHFRLLSARTDLANPTPSMRYFSSSVTAHRRCARGNSRS